jgi:hypothetical protein
MGAALMVFSRSSKGADANPLHYDIARRADPAFLEAP